MTHPSRDMIAQIVREGMKRLAASQAGARPVVSASKEADRVTDAILTALASGSGDHAELARLAEWRDRLRADPGRAAHFGSPYADKPMQNGRTYWNIDLADDITSLLAEIAALRGENEHVKKLRHQAIDRSRLWEIDAIKWETRATEAERKLAEADRAARQIVELKAPPGNDPEQRLKLLSLLAKAQVLGRTFISKEAERG